MVWYFFGVYITNRTLCGRLKIWNFSSRVDNNFTSSLCSFMKYFQHSKRNFVSPRSHVISSISLKDWKNISVTNDRLLRLEMVCSPCLWILNQQTIITNLIKNKVRTATEYKVAIFCRKEKKTESKISNKDNSELSKRYHHRKTIEKITIKGIIITKNVNQTTRCCNDNLEKNKQIWNY